MRFAIVTAAALMTSSAAFAQSAPFCLVDATGTRCHYYSLPDCQRDARVSQGGCVTNANRDQSSNSGSGSNWWGNAMNSYELGRRAREDREARASAQPNATGNATWTQFCARMQQNDFDMLEALAPRLTTDEYAAATRNYVNRADYCRSLAGQ